MADKGNRDNEASRGGGADRAALAAGAPGWLLRYRVTVPERSAHHVHRGALLERCMPTTRRLTVLLAGGGFGKTTLLAECCRALRGDDVPVAWLTLEDEEPGMLDNYLALAFEEAGLDVLGQLGGEDTDAKMVHHRAALVVRAVEAHGGPCVLALDELERLANPGAVALLNFLVRSCPAGLHLALAGRKLPAGLDISAPVLGGRAQTLTYEDLRFSVSEIGDFFDKRLTRRELDAVAEESAGWPMALRIHRNAADRPRSGAARLFGKVVEDWVESRLWFDLSEEERDLVLDAGQFEWLTSDLLEAVCGQSGSMRRLSGLSGLDGLLEPVDTSEGNVWRLHPLLQEYCGERRRREAPRRYKATHRRIAEALAARGDVVTATRHAALAGDGKLVGRILSEAGGVRLWLWEGADRLVAAARHVSDETIAAYPELALMRCMTLAISGRIREARRQYESAMRGTLSGETDVDLDTGIDRLIVRGAVAHFACESVGSESSRAIFAHTTRVAEMKGVDSVVRGTMAYGLGYAHEQRAEFDAAQRWGEKAQQLIGGRSTYVRMGVDMLMGQIAMAQGRVRRAGERYRRGLGAARADFLREPRLTVYAEAMAGELALERNRTPGHAAVGRISMDWYASCPRFAAYAAASELALEGAFAAGGVDGALQCLEEMTHFARATELATVGRLLAALNVATLSRAGRVGEAGRAWRTAALPDTEPGCLDLDGQSWREMEALCCARLRLLTARGKFGAARALAGELLQLANARGLRRTAMRALALAMSLEWQAGNESAAVSHAAAYLALFAETDYARSLVSEGEAAAKALRALLEVRPKSPHRATARTLLDAIEAPEPAAPMLSLREAEVLGRLETETDLQIARALGITRDGVRYYVKRLFEKLEVRSRFAAVRRARRLGILPDEN